MFICLNNYLKTIAFCIALMFFPAVLTAKDTSPPASIAGQSYYFHVIGNKGTQNPNAGFSYVMRFGAHSYDYQIIGSSNIIKGDKYTYKVNDGECVIHLHEVFNGKPTEYVMILNPRGAAVGSYQYIQNAGGISPGERSNLGAYTQLIFKAAPE